MTAAPPRPRLLAWTAVAATVVLVLAATLVPGGGTARQPFQWCLICGDEGTVDAIVNVVLFIPFGLACAAAGARTRSAVAFGAALSFAIEMTQLWLVRGRYPGLADIVANTAGAWLGVAAVQRRWLPRLIRSPAFLFVELAVAALGTALPRLLFQTARASGPLFGSWTPAKAGFAVYRGRVLSAALPGLPLPSWQLENAPRVAAALEAGEPLDLVFTVGPTAWNAYLFGVTAGNTYEVVLLTIDRDDLVSVVHTRARQLRLAQPRLRFPGGLAGRAVGDTVRLRFRRAGSSWCLDVGATTRCAGWGVASGWEAVVSSIHVGARGRPVAGALWLAILWLPVGFAVWRRIAPGRAAVL